MTKDNTNNITSISIGCFDGMHIAHQKLLSKLDKNSAIIIIQNKYHNLTPKKTKELYTNHKCYYYNLDDIRELDGKEFIKIILNKFTNLKKIVVGFDFKFGKNARYNTEHLKSFFDGEVVVVDEIKLNNESVHSKAIRQSIIDGDINKANAMLGRDYCIEGKCIRGLGLGSKEFVPTINIKSNKYLLPKNGVWLTLCKIKNATKYGYENKTYNSITFIGHKASINGEFAIETHILKLNSINTLPPKKIKISFKKYMRENKQFSSFDELKKQINADISNAKTYFNIRQTN